MHLPQLRVDESSVSFIYFPFSFTRVWVANKKLFFLCFVLSAAMIIRIDEKATSLPALHVMFSTYIHHYMPYFPYLFRLIFQNNVYLCVEEKAICLSWESNEYSRIERHPLCVFKIIIRFSLIYFDSSSTTMVTCRGGSDMPPCIERILWCVYAER